MKFTISTEIFEKFPELNIVVAIARGIDNKVFGEELTKLLREEEYRSRIFFQAMKIADHPNINCWRKTYTTFGTGSHYRSSVKALIKRVMRGDKIPIVNKLVDIYNLVSLKHVLPVGGEDLDCIKGDIGLVIASGNENFRAIDSEVNDPPQKGEVVYVDGKNEVLCRRFNWREAEKTKLTEKTKNAIIVIEGIPPVIDIEVKEAAQELTRLIQKSCGGAVELFLLNKNFLKAYFRY